MRWRLRETKMEKDRKEEPSQIILKKNMPTFFPFGFSVGGTQDGMVVINFLDQPGDGQQNIVASVALTQQRAKLFAEKLLSAIENQHV